MKCSGNQGRLLCMAVCGALVASAGVGRAGTVTSLWEFFDSGTVGLAPAGWTVGTANGYGVVTNDIFQSGPNSFLFANTNSPNFQHALKALSPTISSTQITNVAVNFRINLAQTNAAFNVALTDAGTIPLTSISFNNGGKITASTNGGSAFLMNYSSNVWYNVHLDINMLGNLFDVYISTNDTLAASATGLTVAADTSFVYFYLQSYGAIGQKTFAHVDNITVTIPESGTLAYFVLGIGGLLAARRGRPSETGVSQVSPSKSKI